MYRLICKIFLHQKHNKSIDKRYLFTIIFTCCSFIKRYPPFRLRFRINIITIINDNHSENQDQNNQFSNVFFILTQI